MSRDTEKLYACEGADLMENTKNQQSNLSVFPEETPQKTPYSAPKILSREVLEAVAAVCNPPNGKTQAEGCMIPSS